jgi:GTP-binding protein Era
VVALLGPPNAGKSTLLNRLLGEKLAIVTPRPQTTRSRLLGILTLPDAQLLLTDTPGRHAGGRPLNAALNAVVDDVARDCDLGLLLVDPAAGWEGAHASLLALLRARGVPALEVGTQIDRAAARRAPWPPPEAEGAAGTLRVSARSGEGMEALLAAAVALLPEGPALHPPDAITDRPLRFLVAELVREAAFQELRQEIPYHLAVDVQDYDEADPRLVRIAARLLVERESQKAIAIGAGGRAIKTIGTRARGEIERLLGARVYLDLRVKVEPRWSRDPKRLEALGYR